jgi:hypothetical protein
MPYPLISVTDAPYAVAPVTGQMGYFGKVAPKKPYTPSPAFQKMQATVAARKAARCARRQQRVQSMCSQSQARLASKNLHPRKLARLTAALSRRCTRQNAVLSKHCAATAVATLVPIADSTNPNAIDMASFNSDMSDWNDCMAGQTTCATDDCGLQSDCNDPNNFDPDKAGCIADWKSCMAGDKTCATDWCGDKPAITDYTFANEGLSGFGDAGSNWLLIGGVALLAWILLKKK